MIYINRVILLGFSQAQETFSTNINNIINKNFQIINYILLSRNITKFSNNILQVILHIVIINYLIRGKIIKS